MTIGVSVQNFVPFLQLVQKVYRGSSKSPPSEFSEPLLTMVKIGLRSRLYVTLALSPMNEITDKRTNAFLSKLFLLGRYRIICFNKNRTIIDIVTHYPVNVATTLLQRCFYVVCPRGIHK